MAQIMKLFSSYLGPAVDNNLNLGAGTARWTDFFLTGKITTATTIIVNSLTVNQYLTVQNNSKATLNTNVINSAGAVLANGDIWFQTSSNVVYLFARSAGFNFFVQMNT